MFVRFCAMALAVLALAGCAAGDGGYYGTTPAYRDYYDQAPYYGPHYGGRFGHYPYFHDFDDDDDDRYFRPARGVICDRARGVCYDRHGTSHQATKGYFGEREAHRTYRKDRDKEPTRAKRDERRKPRAERGDDRADDRKQRPFPLRDGDDDDRNRPRVGVLQRDDDDRPAVRPPMRRNVDTGKPQRLSGGACPPKGCSRK